MKTRQLVGALIALLLYLFLVPALLFIAAGTAKWPMGWVYTGLLLASTVGSRLIVLKRNPDTLRERARFTSSEGTAAWDRVLVPVVGIVGPAVTMVIAGLDHRWAWSAPVPLAVQILGAVLIAVGYGVAVWAMVENRYFSSVARIQSDRGQEVVTTGPYRLVRHPSYAGAVLACLALPLMLEALWAYLPALLMAMATVIRAAFEDQMLCADLEGYARYAQRTRYRLFPGVW